MTEVKVQILGWATITIFVNSNPITPRSVYEEVAAKTGIPIDVQQAIWSGKPFTQRLPQLRPNIVTTFCIVPRGGAIFEPPTKTVRSGDTCCCIWASPSAYVVIVPGEDTIRDAILRFQNVLGMRRRYEHYQTDISLYPPEKKFKSLSQAVVIHLVAYLV